jgi:hypothetical protein
VSFDWGVISDLSSKVVPGRGRIRVKRYLARWWAGLRGNRIWRGGWWSRVRMYLSERTMRLLRLLLLGLAMLGWYLRLD